MSPRGRTRERHLTHHVLQIGRGRHMWHQYFAEQGPRLALLHNIRDGSSGPQVGLRRAQVGAVWALAAHFTVSREMALVSMPTGSGKTAVMTLLPYLVSARRVLVVVPTRLLRDQVGAEFSSLATLRRTRTCPDEMPGPRVFQAAKALKDADSWAALADYDVIVGTPNCLSPAYPAIAVPPPGMFDLVLIDEAHHFPAETWRALADANPDAQVGLFTATPFRRDRKALEARTVFVYSLRQALADEVLRPVTFHPVPVEPGSDIDMALAAAASRRLRSEEHAQGGSRLLVRTDTVDHAKALVDVYAHAGVRVGLVTNRSSAAQVRRTLGQLRDGSLDGLVNVGVLGEGFDYPELKIGVYHRRHRSLPATLQFLGRISRVSMTSAPAELLAVRGEVQDETRELYASEASWAELLPGLVDAAIAEERERREFLATFGPMPTGPISLAAVKPRKHFQVFRVPQGLWSNVDLSVSSEFIGGTEVVHDTTDADGLTKVVITQEIVRPEWIDSPVLDAPHFELYVVCAFPDYGLLFIHAPDDRRALALADTVGLADAELVEPEWIDQMMAAQRLISYFSIGMRSVQPGGRRVATYRSMAGQSVGTAVQASESRLYASGHAIARITDPLAPEAECVRTTSLGVSHGRSTLFSPDHASLLDIRRWCQRLAELAATISVNPAGLPGLALHSFRRLDAFPEHPYAAIMDPYLLWQGLYAALADGTVAHLDAMEVLASCGSNERLRVDLLLESRRLWSSELDTRGNVSLLGGDLQVYAIGGAEPIGQLSELLADYPPTIFYGNASASRGRSLLRAATDYPDLDETTLVNWELENVDMSAESKQPGPSQINVHDWAAGHLTTANPEQWIIKDDGSGELADILVVQPHTSGPAQLAVTFVHCKWSSRKNIGRRLDDLYELMGQALRTVRWTGSGIIWSELSRRLQSRASTRIIKGNPSRIAQAVASYAAAPPGMTVNVICVQPGIDASQVNSWPAGKPLVCATREWLINNDIEMKLVGGRNA